MAGHFSAPALSPLSKGRGSCPRCPRGAGAPGRSYRPVNAGKGEDWGPAKNTIIHALNMTMNTEDIVGTFILFTYFVVQECDVTITLR